MIRIPAKGVMSLSFDGDELIDWVGGARAFGLDGTDRGRRVNYTYRFDAATTSADGRYAIIYELLGTKALLLDRGEVVRELKRSHYCAEAYEYPIHIFRVPDGRTVIAHCPDEYNHIELEDVATATRLTASTNRKPEDFFHSRLTSNPSGTRLLSAGWIWHPFDTVVYFDVDAALRDPAHFDSLNAHSATASNVERGEHASACWLSDDHVALASGRSLDDAAPSLAVFDLSSNSYLRSFKLVEPAGTMMRLDESHVVSFYKHPKIISLTSGEVVREWRELSTGTQTSSICDHLRDSIPPMAFDPTRRRFAVADSDNVFVVTVDPTI